ncbi:MAG: penicillin acylase family protein [Dokdonella sp.]|uniref:penicillin acylase family protein n=1 Tax=Dokdonella sp. TaxID=2291710 RepID=UPI0032658819
MLDIMVVPGHWPARNSSRPTVTRLVYHARPFLRLGATIVMRFLRRFAALLFVLVVVIFFSAWLALRGSLPEYDGTIRSTALTAPVSVERDALGTVTVRAVNRLDAGWALGYAHAQERYFEMDLLRRRAAGELAELFGSAALPLDRAARAHRMRARMQAAYSALPAADREAIDRYRDGVNAGITALSVRPFAYLLTRSAPAPWRSEDSLLIIAAMAFTLNDSEDARELAFARMHAALPASAFRFLTASGGAQDAPIAGAPLTWPDIPDAAELDLHALDAHLLKHANTTVDRIPGSNSFAVNGALADGAALVANDTHLDLRVPSLWFRARLIYPNPRRAGHTTDVSGVGLPGTSAIVIGSNGNVAWGFTNSYIDTADWVRVLRDPADSSRYRTADGWMSIVKHSETIRVHGAADATLDIEETRWGPILGKEVDGTPLALAWSAQEPGAINLELMRIDQAETSDEAIAIAQASGLPPQNFVVGDRQGSIAWTIAGRIPNRIGGFDPALPADWSAPATGWDGWVGTSDTPLISNPPWQRLWTANQRVVEGPALALLGDGGYDLGARAAQIRDDLTSRKHITTSDMLDIQLDDRALLLGRWKELMRLELNRTPASTLNTSMLKVLDGWNGEASVDSVSYRLVRAWRTEVIDTVLDGFFAAVRKQFPDFTPPKLAQSENALWKLLQLRPPHLLPPGYTDWDGLLIACAERTGAALDSQPGGLSARTWGERNTTHIAHPLSRALPAFLARLIDMPHQALPGDSNMPRVQGVDFGASQRMAVAPGNEVNGYLMMSGGQSGHPLSPYYGSGHADWAEGKPTPFLPGPAQHTLMLTPDH